MVIFSILVSRVNVFAVQSILFVPALLFIALLKVGFYLPGKAIPTVIVLILHSEVLTMITNHGARKIVVEVVARAVSDIHG